MTFNCLPIRNAVVLSILYIVVTVMPSLAAEPITIPSETPDSQACIIIEGEYIRALTVWKSGSDSAALEVLLSCEKLLKRTGLWAPVKKIKNPTELQKRTRLVTNSVIFSLASINQRLKNKKETIKYASWARERNLIPKVTGAKNKQ